MVAFFFAHAFAYLPSYSILVKQKLLLTLGLQNFHAYFTAIENLKKSHFLDIKKLSKTQLIFLIETYLKVSEHFVHCLVFFDDWKIRIPNSIGFVEAASRSFSLQLPSTTVIIFFAVLSEV